MPSPLPPLVDADWLVAHRTQVRVIDSRWYLDGRSGRAAFDGGHIPGAVWVDLDRDLSGVGSRDAGRHPLPAPDAFAVAMSRLGVGDDTPVVVYDDAAGSIAARLWWLLHVLAHPVAVLDGGIAAWPHALTSDESAWPPARFTPRPWPGDRFADRAQIVDRLRDPAGSLLLDARAAARYEHGDPAIDPRPGHIPGARNAPWALNVDRATNRLDSADSLRERYGRLGVGDAADVIAYCGSGVTACHDLLALEVAGFGTRTRLYTGSWSQWGAAAELPAETGG